MDGARGCRRFTDGGDGEVVVVAGGLGDGWLAGNVVANGEDEEDDGDDDEGEDDDDDVGKDRGGGIARRRVLA